VPGRRFLLPGGLLVLAAVLVVLVGLALRTQGAAAARTGADPSTPSRDVARVAPQARAATPARRLASLVTPEAPTAARLPSGRTVPVLPVSTRADRTLDVPDDIRLAGWWRGGGRMGDPFGAMLVAAHIDSRTQGLGPFAELLTVRRAQRIAVTSAHLRQDFVVSSRRLVRQGSLADERWLFAPTGDSRLVLVTCAPPYDRSLGGYQNLALVTALPVAGPVERSGS